MKTSDILTLELANKGEIHLYKEGVFWKAYQQSAYLFHTRVCPYQVKTKYIKCIGKSVASSGFPDSSLPHLFKEDVLLTVDKKK